MPGFSLVPPAEDPATSPEAHPATSEVITAAATIIELQKR
jgi:hypothetical protein